MPHKKRSSPKTGTIVGLPDALQRATSQMFLIKETTVMSTKKAISHALWHRAATRNTLLMLCVFGAAAATGPAFATVTYNAGALNFATQNQSMWGPGKATVKSGSTFVGPSWGPTTTTLFNVMGGSVVHNPFHDSWSDCEQNAGIFKFVCGSEPSQTIDTRTGAEVTLQSSGKLGLNFGYKLNSGSVDSSVGFGATAEVPHTVQKLQSFSLGTNSALNSGAITTQSPEISANMNLIDQFSGSITGTGCFIGAGCATSSSNLPVANVDQKLLELTPNELEVLPGVIPNGADDGSLAHVSLLNQDIPINYGESQIGDLTTHVPDIATTGGLNGNSISSNGKDEVLGLSANLADLSGLFGFPTNGEVSVEEDGFLLKAGLSLFDLNIGPTLDLGQNFDLTPTLMTNLAFSRPVQIAGDASPQSSWSGAWANLPSLALFGTTTFTPTFWLEAPMTNQMSLDLGLDGTWDLLKFEFDLQAGALPPLDISESLSGLLGLSSTLFSTPTLNFPIFSNKFYLGGFNMINAAPFTIYTGSSIAVPEPPIVPLFLLGLGALAGLAYFGREYDPRDVKGKFCAKGMTHA